MTTTTARLIKKTDKFTSKDASQPRFLIIGYGNELRGDDAAGPYVATHIATWALSDVRSLSVHQLTPDLASDVSRADYAIFVDACGGDHCSRTVQLEPIVGDRTPSSLPHSTTHHGSPWTLLNLAEGIYGHAPQGWLLQIPTECFDLGAGLSSTTQSGCDFAIKTIENFLQTYQ